MLNRRNAGYSLVELLVAAAIMGVVISYIMGFFGSQHHTYMVVDQVAETQQNSRAIAGLIERDIRSAGYMVPPAAAACGRDSIGAADQLFLSDSNAILPVDELAASLRSQQLGAKVSGNPGTGTSVSMTVDNVVIDGEATYATALAAPNDTDFNPAGAVILIDLANPSRGVACGMIGDINPPTNVVVNMTIGLGAGTPNAPDLRLIPAIAYQVITPAGSTIPELQRNGIIFARDVEDLQLAWFYDDNGDGQVDAAGDEYRATAGTTFVANTIDGNDLREIRFNLVLRTPLEDTQRPSAAGVGQRTENRVNAIPAADGRRRRVHTATIRLRNIPAS